LHVDEMARVVVSGVTGSEDFPTTNGAFASPGAGNTDVFAARLDLLPTGVTAFGRSSPGCRGVLVASVTSVPSVGNAAFEITCTQAPELAVGTLLLAAGPLGSGLPVLGIELWVDVGGPWVPVSAVSDLVGFAAVGLALPSEPALVGASVFAQFLWLGPTAPPPCPPIGLSASQGLQIEIQP
jgi:hypothetical protein